MSGGGALRILSISIAALALALVSAVALAAPRRAHNHHLRHSIKPDPCAVVHKAKAKPKRKRGRLAIATRHHRSTRRKALRRSRCRTVLHRRVVVVHQANGPYPGTIAKETNDEGAPVLPAGPYRPRYGPKLAVPGPPAAAAARAPGGGAFAADATAPVEIGAVVDPASAGLGAASADQESSEAIVGNLILFTSNWRAGYSTDFGRTFKALNPATVFPAAAGGFCCDQVVIYAPQVDRVFWILQYNNDANGENVIRVAWASPAGIAREAEKAWSYVDLSSKSIVGAGKCFDQPHVGLAQGYLLMEINQCVGGKVSQSVMFELTLSTLDKPQIGLSYGIGGPVSAIPARSSGSLFYYVAQKDTSTLRVFHWKPGEGSIYFDDVAIPTIATSNWTSKTPGGVDWLTRQQNSQGTKVTGVTLAGGKLWAMWSAGRETIDNEGNTHFVRSQPAIEGAIISLKGDGSADSASPVTYYNNSFAVAMPDIATNADGEVGLSFEQGGGTAYPRHVVGIVSGVPQFAFDVAGSADNAPSACGSPCPGDPAGDYTTVGVESPASSCFTSSGVAHTTAEKAPTPRSLPRVLTFARRGTQGCAAPPPGFAPSPPPSTTTITCPPQVTAGESFGVSGGLTPAHPGVTIRVQITRPDGSIDEHDVNTDAASNYSTSEATAPSELGTWRVVASWAGDGKTSPSSAGCAVHVVAPPPPGLLPSTISIYCPSSADPAHPESFQAGETVTTTGGVYTYPTKPANAPVIVDYVPESPNDTEFTDTVMTDASGNYSDSVKLPSVFPHGGYWDVYTYWNGNSEYQGETSGTCRIYQYQAIG